MDKRDVNEVQRDLLNMIAHLHSCWQSGNEFVLRDAFADVSRALELMRERQEIS